MPNLNIPTVELVSTLRAAPENGQTSSQDYNDSWTESLADLASLSGFINDILIPMLNGLSSTIQPISVSTPHGIEGRYLLSDTSDTTQVFYDNLTNQPLSVADSLRILNGILTSIQATVANLNVEVTTLQSELSATNQNDISQALQNFAASLQNLTEQTVNNTVTIENNVIDLQTNGVDNPVQSKLNLIAGTNVTLTNTGSNVLISSGSTGSDSVTFDGITSGSVTIGATAIAGTPNRINFPTTTGTVGQVLSTDGGTPQQTSWITPTSGVAGVSSEIQSNQSGVLYADANFTYNPNAPTSGLAPLVGIGATVSATHDFTAATIYTNYSGTIAHSWNYGLDIQSILSTTSGSLGTMAGLHTYVNGAPAEGGGFTTNLVGADIHVNTGTGGTQTNGIGVNVTFSGGADPSYCYGLYVQPMAPDFGAVVWGTYCANTGGYFGAGSNVTWGGATKGIASIGAAATSSTSSFVLTQITNNGGGTTTYTGTITGGAANAFAGSTFVISGFLLSNCNNGTFIATASTATSITVTSGYSVNETHAGTALLVPNQINLPISTGTAGQLLSTNGANPQQTSWVAPVAGSTTNVQVNAGGNLYGDGNFTYNYTTGLVTIAKTASITGVGTSGFSPALTVTTPANSTASPVMFGSFIDNSQSFQGVQITSAYTGSITNTNAYHYTEYIHTNSLTTGGVYGALGGLFIEVDANSSAGGTITNLYGINCLVNSGTGSAQTNYTVYNAAFGGTQDATTGYGFRIQTALGGAVTNLWGFYSDNCPNFFGGNTQLTGVANSIVTKTANYTATLNDYTILMNAAGATTVTLPTSQLGGGLFINSYPHTVPVGQLFRVKNINTGTVTVVGQTGNIDGAANFILSTQYSAAEFQWDGSNWWVF